MENEHELSYETLTRVYLGSYEHYKGVGAEVEHSKPGTSLMILGSYGSKGLLPYGFEKEEMWCEFEWRYKGAIYSCLEIDGMEGVGGAMAEVAKRTVAMCLYPWHEVFQAGGLAA
ncbi:hypothetical protein Tco_0425709 [Tanacetum coccineum]